MNLDNLLCNVAVIGAAGKMGSGIATLLTHELTNLKIKNPEQLYRLHLIDINEKALDGLQQYLKNQMTKMAEKAIVSLRAAYANREDLVENWEIINAFVEDALSLVRLGTDITMAKNSPFIFEAAIENAELKISLLKQLKEICPPDTCYFTNTSSIPVGYLDTQAGLNGKIVGYHFYNPPVVQKLVEVITSENTPPELKDISLELGKRLRKKLVPANDIAGFIGNGHFIRDGLYALAEVKRLSETYTFPEALYIMNRVSQDFLVRPMGIFQLIDYVGIDVFQCILKVMNQHLSDASLHSEVIDSFMEKGVKGGQRANGSQKDGFFSYPKNRLAGIYDPKAGDYLDIGEIMAKLDRLISAPPEGYFPWKKLLKDKQRDEKLTTYFNNLQASDTFGANLATKYLNQSKAIGEALVADGVAQSELEVNEVLINGFYWLYGPINQYC